ncbi:MAG: retron St85 family effector protein [Pseudomonadota bacterium]
MAASEMDPRLGLIKSIEIDRSRVLLEPRILFVCGGPVDVRVTSNHSVRNMFMNLSGGCTDNDKKFILAEDFKDWRTGYRNLSDFENDIAAVSSLVVVFLESEGALAEFGLFYANENIRKKLVVCIHSEFHVSESFIKLGLLNPLEEENQESVRVYEIDHRRMDKVDKSEISEILSDVVGFCGKVSKSEAVKYSDRGHYIFIVFQIIDMFLALTKGEISEFIIGLGLDGVGKNLDSALFILEKFGLVVRQKKSSQYFYFSSPNQSMRVDWSFSGENKRQSLQSIKIKIAEYYRHCAENDPSHRRRMKVVESVHLGEHDAAF